ncbi:protein tyrosine phosphatase family protein [Gloeocapsopsis crepidinum LEGE 06123]|uniref:Protein tyrosine phosphatase family protein n=1 Tax=Gloeocapsopsis crepidinum LEGE 06123 TaxID=588587 RepID=A0ABR9UQB0_9CHRO|nr:protein tyrosine phosphatase family protein [Gloeocapsopsis crepidinum]MBE9190470.1 protein tyrosine phosphatase family protein [Gloeocapsopsis crepidinum LEGE 06123]
MSTQLENIYNFLRLSDSIATAGQPVESQFTDIKAAGYEVVVNLVPTSTSAITNEQTIVEDLGMKYVHIPVIWEKPTLEDIERFFKIMQANADKNIFVHCAMNMRVSAFMYLYRIIHEHINTEEAKQDLQKIWQPNETWQQFIEKVIEHYQK